MNTHHSDKLRVLGVRELKLDIVLVSWERHVQYTARFYTVGEQTGSKWNDEQSKGRCAVTAGDGDSDLPALTWSVLERPCVCIYLSKDKC